MKKPLRIIFMGTPDFGVPSLQALLDDDRFEVLAVVTQPDRPVGRKQVLTPPPVKQVAAEARLPVFQPTKVRSKSFLADMRELAPDLCVVIAYGKILPQSFLDIPKKGCVNVHGSLLPLYRGASPIQATLLHGETTAGITIMEMSLGMDEGDMITQHTLPIDERETAGTLFTKLSTLSSEVLPQVLVDYCDGHITPSPQPEPATYCSMLSKEMGYLDGSDESLDAYRKYQAFTPWPGVYTFVNNTRVKLLEVEHSSKDMPPAELTESDDGLYFPASDGSLRVLRLQEAGKKPQEASEYLRGKQGVSLKLTPPPEPNR